jgi:LemA protein
MKLLILLCIPLLYGIFLFNKLVRLKNLIQEAWSGIDVQLKRRHDLIPNIVEMVKGYAKHEKTTLEEVVELRNKSEAESNPKEKQDIENNLTSSLKKLLILVEDYPDLKADKNFLQLQETLIEVEDNLQYARRYYNGTVRNLNSIVEAFPSNLIAQSFGFKRYEFFEIDFATERKSPEIKL